MTEGDLRELDREAFIEHQLAGYQQVPLDQIRLWPHLFAELATRQPVDPARVAALAGCHSPRHSRCYARSARSATRAASD